MSPRGSSHTCGCQMKGGGTKGLAGRAWGRFVSLQTELQTSAKRQLPPNKDVCSAQTAPFQRGWCFQAGLGRLRQPNLAMVTPEARALPRPPGEWERAGLARLTQRCPGMRTGLGGERKESPPPPPAFPPPQAGLGLGHGRAA